MQMYAPLSCAIHATPQRCKCTRKWRRFRSLHLQKLENINTLVGLSTPRRVSRPTPGDVSQHALRQTPLDSYCRRWYTSYWNAFLYFYLSTSPRHEMNKPNLRVFYPCTENVNEIKISQLDINISSNTHEYCVHSLFDVRN